MVGPPVLTGDSELHPRELCTSNFAATVAPKAKLYGDYLNAVIGTRHEVAVIIAGEVPSQYTVLS